MKVYIEGRRNGYAPDQCGHTMTVGELIEWLAEFPEDAELYLRNDGGYTYGNITEDSFEANYTEEEDD